MKMIWSFTANGPLSCDLWSSHFLVYLGCFPYQLGKSLVSMALMLEPNTRMFGG